MEIKTFLMTREKMTKMELTQGEHLMPSYLFAGKLKISAADIKNGKQWTVILSEHEVEVIKKLLDNQEKDGKE